MNDDALLLARRRQMVDRQLRRSVRGVALSLLVAGVVLSGLVPMSATAASTLLVLAGVLALTRILRGLWAVRVARHLLGGWSARRGLPGHRVMHALPAPAPLQESADRRAVRALTEGSQEPLMTRAREQGLAMVDRMEELRTLLADQGLSAVLRRPLAEELARVEAELEALTAVLGDLSRAERSQRDDLLQRLAARLEVDRQVPAGLLAPA